MRSGVLLQREKVSDYIDKIKQNMQTPGITDSQKQEVIDYIRALWVTGKLNRTVDFRLVLSACDLRLMDTWKLLISAL